ncbi:MAG TPA: site-specific DNA-methyltransferase, partial [Brevibacterium linens]|nr:site-specific DNA-methyltransferase [Brevibacterium linens]
MTTVLEWPGKAAVFALGRRLIADSETGPSLGEGEREPEPSLGEDRPRLRDSDGAAHAPDPHENLLVVGDNLPALQALLATHRGRVKVVYIDPPYNTGNAHTYKDHGHDHASWLSFM